MSIIAFAGDVYMHNPAYIDYEWPDTVVFNLEYVICDGTQKPLCNKVNLSSKYCDFKNLFNGKCLIASLANNHIMDFGELGFRNTIDILSKKHIKYFGAGSDKDNYGNPLIIKSGDKAIALLAYSQFNYPNGHYSTAPIERQRILKDINYVKTKSVDRVVCIVHWGIEEDPIQNKEQISLAHFMIDNGVDLVVGHHPHCIQPFEVYKEKYIFYSVGNFYFENIESPSFYDEKQIPQRIYRKRQLKHNRTALAVWYDTEKNTVVAVHKMHNKKNRIVYKENVLFNKINAKIRCSNLCKRIRKYKSFFYSNFFADGKLFDLSALKHEYVMKKNRKH